MEFAPHLHLTSLGTSGFNGDIRNTQDSAKKAREHELERKRMCGEASCAECKRMKLKCDKKVPCASCTKRGCSTICPNGTLSAGQGSRYVLANTDKLHAKILELSKRVRQLEDALQIAQSAISSAPHPLLSAELMTIKTSIEVLETNEDPVDDTEVATSFGTLTIANGGDSRFLGHMGSESLIASAEMTATKLEVTENGRTDSIKSNSLSNDLSRLLRLSEKLPFNPADKEEEDMRVEIISHLPSWERATALVDAYLENISWFFKPVEREQIEEELMPKYYNRPRPPDPPCISNQGESQDIPDHEISLLFMIFAWGAVADLNQNPTNKEAEHYRRMACAALNMSSVFQNTSMATVQTISMLGSYDIFNCRLGTLETAWKLDSFALCLAASIGLHRDPARWNLSPKLTQRRRSFFWELYSVDSWKSLGTGRPAIFNNRVIDCEFPQDRDAYISEDGTTIMGYWRWKHIHTKRIVSEVAAQLCEAGPVKYSKILELDRKIREHATLNSAYSHGKSIDGRPRNEVLRVMCELFREKTLLFVHRNFFARAMREPQGSPLRIPFAPSFLASYASALSLLRIARGEYDRMRNIFIRYWPLWAHALVAGVIIGTVAVKDSVSALTSTALQELESTIGLFEKTKAHPMAENGLPILLRLKEKALSNRRNGTESTSEAPMTILLDSTPGVKREDVDDELLILGGVARFLMVREDPTKGSTGGGNPNSVNSFLGTPSISQTQSRIEKSASPTINPFMNFDPRDSTAGGSSDVHEWLRYNEHPTRREESPDLHLGTKQVPAVTHNVTSSEHLVQQYNFDAQTIEGGAGGQGADSVSDFPHHFYRQRSQQSAIDTTLCGHQLNSIHSTPEHQVSSMYDGIRSQPHGLANLSLFDSVSVPSAYVSDPMIQAFSEFGSSGAPRFMGDTGFNIGGGGDVFIDAMLAGQHVSGDPTIADSWRAFIENTQLSDLGVEFSKEFDDKTDVIP